MKLSSKTLKAKRPGDKLLDHMINTEVYDARTRDDYKLNQPVYDERESQYDECDKGIQTLNESITNS